jgi:hypothetical protein
LLVGGRMLMHLLAGIDMLMEGRLVVLLMVVL